MSREAVVPIQAIKLVLRVNCTPALTLVSSSPNDPVSVHSVVLRELAEKMLLYPIVLYEHEHEHEHEQTA